MVLVAACQLRPGWFDVVHVVVCISVLLLLSLKVFGSDNLGRDLFFFFFFFSAGREFQHCGGSCRLAKTSSVRRWSAQ